MKIKVGDWAGDGVAGSSVPNIVESSDILCAEYIGRDPNHPESEDWIEVFLQGKKIQSEFARSQDISKLWQELKDAGVNMSITKAFD